MNEIFKYFSLNEYSQDILHKILNDLFLVITELDECLQSDILSHTRTSLSQD